MCFRLFPAISSSRLWYWLCNGADFTDQVPVYEFKVEGDGVMRRRSDDWINATHILKASGFDKPARTRILEREVQKGTHEKVQGGYGKYQGNSECLYTNLDFCSSCNRNMDSAARRSFTFRAQQQPWEATADFRLYPWRSKPSSCAKTFYIVETEGPQKQFQQTENST